MKLWIMVLLLLVGSFSVYSQVPITPELEQDIDEIEAITQDIRQLDELEPVMLYFPSRDELAAFIDESLTEVADLIERDRYFYAAFGFIPLEVDLYQLYSDVLNDQIGGYYDPETKLMNVVVISDEEIEGELPTLEKIIFSHEYVHALQDQYFDLKAMQDMMQDPSIRDQVLGIQALIEGDASAAMGEYVMALMQDDPNVFTVILEQGNNLGGPTITDDLPPIVLQELLFPYVQGARFVGALLVEGGWERVDRTFTEFPASTEHVYHADRYLSGDMPLEVAIIDSLPVLGDDWEQVHEGNMGEFYIRHYLDIHLSANDVNIAATGWGGDYYTVYHNADSVEFAWVLRTLWDTPEDASQFYVAAQDYGAVMYGAVIDSACWSDAVSALCVVPEGDDGVLLTYAPTQEMASALMEHQQ